MKKRKFIFIICLIFNCLLCFCGQKNPKINIWYGEHQSFGKNGIPQQWINILGNVTGAQGIDSLYYSLNQGKQQSLSMGPDGRRLAKAGDFNIELDHQELNIGENEIRIVAVDSAGIRVDREIHIHYHPQKPNIPQYQVDWETVRHIQNAVQVVDGLWKLAQDGIRITEPYYDRALALGDMHWQNYEVTVEVIFHGMRIPRREQGDRGADVIHVAIATRWPGHDEDGKNLRTKWYPLGATAEFRIEPDWQNCSWRILGGKGKVTGETTSVRQIMPETRYIMKHRVETLEDSSTLYSVKLWKAAEPEPTGWDLRTQEGPEDIQNGGILLIAHYSVVTFGDIAVSPIYFSSD
ncbi:hypothetical protein GF337_01645 [candidate division KSB1 bacterium]|nr:hypothetical protein [candidate division KSB1 bacterium]